MRTHEIKRVFVGLAAATILAWGFSILADGALDATFDTDGITTTPIGSLDDGARSVAIQSDGKILVGGYTDAGVSTHWDFCLVRYNASGSLDGSFGTGGKVVTSMAANDDAIGAVLIQSDGKIVVVGDANAAGVFAIALARYKTDGTIDSSFGTAGKVTTAIGGVDDRGNSAIFQSDGKIVVVGRSNNGSNRDFAIVRYNANGTLDTGFGTGGKVTKAIGSGDDEANDVVVQSNGKILVSGSSHNGSNQDIVLLRYNSNGTLDTGFGTAGVVTTAIGSLDEVGFQIRLQSDGRIVMAAYTDVGGGDLDMAVLRYDSTGALDATFGTGGKVVTPFGTGFDAALRCLIQPDGKIIVVGWAHNGSNLDFAMVRYTAAGALDGSFGTGGKVTTAIGSGDDNAFAAALQGDFKIVLAGESHNGSNKDFAVVRYEGSSGPPLPAPPQGLVGAAGYAHVVLKWYRGLENSLAGYRIYGGKATSPTTLLDSTTSILDTVKTISNLGNDTTYYFRITSIDSLGNESPYSSQISLTPGKAKNQDSYVRSSQGTSNYGSETNLYFGGIPGPGDSLRLYIQFDVSSLSPFTPITSSRMDFYETGQNGYMNYTYGVYRVKQAWSESNITWRNQPEYDPVPIVTFSGSEWQAIWSWHSIRGLDSLAQLWVDSVAWNLGIMIKPLGEFYGTPYVTSLNSPDTAHRPRFVLNSPGGSISGVAMDSQNSTPLANVIIEACEEVLYSGKIFYAIDTTDALGQFNLRVTYPLKYKIRANGITGYLPKLDSLQVNEGQTMVYNALLDPNSHAVAGEVSGVWTKAQSPFILSNDVVINSQLTIEPGVEVLYAGRYALRVEGKLTAVGNSTDSISFKSYGSPYPKGWGIRFIDADSGSSVHYCTIQDQMASDLVWGSAEPDRGGAIYVRNSAVSIRNCLIQNNQGGEGAGICISGAISSATTIEHSTIRNNHCIENGYNADGGGGIRIIGSAPRIRYNFISSNSAIWNGYNFEGGGAMYIESVSGVLEITNNIFDHNFTGYGKGTAIYSRDSKDLRLHNNVFYGNYHEGPSTGGTVYWGNAFGSSTMAMKNNIFRNNNPDPIEIYSGLSVQVAYNDIQGGFAGTGNIDADPVFQDTVSFKLSAGSPCIDTGSPDLFDDVFILGQSTQLTDMGAYGGPDNAGWYPSFKPDFSATPRAGIAPLNVSFHDSSTGSIAGWLWTFGDGDSAFVQNPSHQFLSIGAFDVALVVTSNGVSKRLERTSYVQSRFQLSTSSIAFGTIRLGQWKDTTFSIPNTGADTLKITNIASSDTSFVARPLSVNIPPGQTFQDTVRFAPLAAGARSGAIRIYSATLTTPDSVVVSGFGALYSASVSWTNASFGPVRVGTTKDTTVTVTNTGNDTLRVTNITVSNPRFSTRRTSFNLAPAQSISDTIAFSPTGAGLDSALVLVYSNATVDPETLKVYGFGAIYALQLNAVNLDIGSVVVGQSKDTTVTLTNTGNDTLRIQSITSSNPKFSVRPTSLTISPGGSANDTLRFSPTAGGEDSTVIVIASNATTSPDTLKVAGFASSPTGVNDLLSEIPKEFSLSQNYPNPFNPSTVIRYGLQERSTVRLEVVDILGQVIDILADGEQDARYYEVQWNSRVASGTYFYRLVATAINDPSRKFTQIRKMVLLK